MQQKGIGLIASGSLHNYKNTFQKQEINEDLGVDVYEFKYRMDDSQTGRFWQVDPLADKYPHNSTYAFSEDRVIDGVELEGMEWVPAITHEGQNLTREQRQEAEKFFNLLGNGIGGILSTIFAPFNYIADAHRAGNVHDPVRKAELNEDGKKQLAQAIIGYGSGLIAGRIMGGVLSMASDASVWGMKGLERGLKIEGMLGGNLPKNFPVIDKFENGVATSIKSVDLTAQTYGKGNNLLNTLKGYVNKLDNFEGAERQGFRIGESDITSKALDVAVQPGKATLDQWEQIGKAMQYAKDNNIQFNLQFIK